MWPLEIVKAKIGFEVCDRIEPPEVARHSRPSNGACHLLATLVASIEK
jgi:hypothetical protein